MSSMFSNLKNNLDRVFKSLKGKPILTEEDINKAFREIRIALLEADVALPVIMKVLENIKQKAVGQAIHKSIEAAHLVTKIVSDELESLLQSENSLLNLKGLTPITIMMIGLQGSGKTTTTAKLAYRLKNNHKKKVLVASVDIYRPAAQKQLEVVSKNAMVDSLHIVEGESPLQITQRALKKAKEDNYDVLIIDTAGRLHTDDQLIKELEELKQLTSPQEILLVADAMTGQDAVNIAQEFNSKIGVTGIVLSRIEGDARGGAALSMGVVTGKPIKFLGCGEHIKDLEEFDAKRIASRILGMGDIVGLVEQAQEMLKDQDVDKLTDKIKKGSFNLDDLYIQLKNIKKLGGVGKLIGMLPSVGGKLMENNAQFGESKIKRQMAIIGSMTKLERRYPSVINGPRKKRIAAGAGVEVSEVNRLLKQYLNMLNAMKKFGNMPQRGMQEITRLFNGKF